MFPLLDSALCGETNLKDKVSYFSCVSIYHGANIDERQIKTIKGKIKEMVASPLTRCEGLLLFEAVLQQYTAFYVENWPNIIYANLLSSEKSCQDITYRILKQILKNSQCTSHSATVEYHIPKILEVLMAQNNSNNAAALQCLAMCIKHHTSIASKYKEDIEHFIVKHWDTNSSQICEAVADCFVALPSCYTGKALNKDNATLFISKRALYTLGAVLNQLLSVNLDLCLDDGNHKMVPTIFELPEIPAVQFSSSMMLTRIFTSLSVCLAKILCYESLEQKFAMWILEFMNKIFQVTFLSKNANSTEYRELVLLVYPAIHKGVFTLLESLIQNLPMVGQVDNIIELFRKSIEASYFSTFTGGGNYHIRYITWKTLNIYINSKGFQVTFDVGNKKILIKELLKDIMPESEEKTLSATPRQHHMSKKTDFAFPEPDETNPYNKIRMKTCIEALKALKGFIYTASPFLEEKFKEDIASSICAVSKTTFKSFYNHKKFPFPYACETCRKNLYELSLSIVVSSNFHIRATMQCVNILKTAQKDQSLQIKEFCGIATPLCRLMMQPKKKFPEPVTNKKAHFELNGEEKVNFGWDNTANWNVNTSDRGNPLTNTTNRSDMLVSTPNETHNNVNDDERQDDFVSDKEYTSSKVDTSQTSHQSESESDVTMGHETVEEEEENQEFSKPFSDAIQLNEVAEEVTTKTVTSEEEEEEFGSESEPREESIEPEESKVDEVEWAPSNREKTVVRADQNGIASSSEEEMSSNMESENEERSYESASFVEEEEDTKECIVDRKREAENLREDEKSVKRQRISEETVEIPQELNEIKTEDITNVHSEVEVSTEPDSIRSKSPSFEEMCRDLVLRESAQLAES